MVNNMVIDIFIQDGQYGTVVGTYIKTAMQHIAKMGQPRSAG